MKKELVSLAIGIQSLLLGQLIFSTTSYVERILFITSGVVFVLLELMFVSIINEDSTRF